MAVAVSDGFAMKAILSPPISFLIVFVSDAQYLVVLSATVVPPSLAKPHVSTSCSGSYSVEPPEKVKLFALRPSLRIIMAHIIVIGVVAVFCMLTSQRRPVTVAGNVVVHNIVSSWVASAAQA